MMEHDEALLTGWADAADMFELTDDWQPYIDPRDGVNARKKSARLFKKVICLSVRKLNEDAQERRFKKLWEKRQKHSLAYNSQKYVPKKERIPLSATVIHGQPPQFPAGWKLHQQEPQPMGPRNEPQTSPAELIDADNYAE